jgi:hypothetical protein
MLYRPLRLVSNSFPPISSITGGDDKGMMNKGADVEDRDTEEHMSNMLEVERMDMEDERLSKRLDMEGRDTKQEHLSKRLEVEDTNTEEEQQNLSNRAE